MSAPDDSSTAIRLSDETAARPVDARGESTARFTPGTLLAGRYRIVSPLGKGGMGEVYRADDIRLGQPVALKFLPAAFAQDSGKLERLVDEVRLGRQIAHPNVCRLYDIAEAEGHHFMVMEYVDGEDLASLLRRIGRLPGDKALEIARGVCAGLAAAHDKGIIHRDLKPANVMIDGRGHARIADFGLAALAGGGGVADMSGTPQYMAPEQLTGQGASLRTDVYALGLVLHEMLTGKRVFEAKSLNELRALHADSKPVNLSGSSEGVNPSFERVVLRCLSRDPNDRPASARAVLASLPGGDALEAAVLAGETPSPEMVAAASVVGDLSPRLAWSALLLGLGGLLFAAVLSDRVALFRMVPVLNAPEVLVARARETLDQLGYAGPARDSAFGFFIDGNVLDHVGRTDPSRSLTEKLRTIRGGPLLFYYRDSPERLVAESWISIPPWAGPPALGRVLRREPPLTKPGMKEVVLDPAGRLVSFAAVPPRFDVGSEPRPEPDWRAPIVEAGFDPAALRPAAAQWTAAVDTDRKAAWEGASPDQPDVKMRIEAASFHGRVVWFELLGPWSKPPEGETAVSPILAFATASVMLLALPFWAAGAILARRNLRTGRGDPRGALRFALFTLVSLTLAQALRADHTAGAIDEHALIVAIVGQGLYAAVVVWTLYMALEPPIRRRWPHTLISWTRVLAGRFQDALVGRDALVGILGGVATVICFNLLSFLPAWFGRGEQVPLIGVVASLNAPRHSSYFVLMNSSLAVLYSLAMLFFFYLFHSVLKRAWAAQLLLFCFVLVPAMIQAGEKVGGWIAATFFAGLMVTIVVRFGLLASMFLVATGTTLTRVPLTLDWTAWYSGRSFAVLGFFTALLVAAAHASLGGKPIFGKPLLDD